MNSFLTEIARKHMPPTCAGWADKVFPTTVDVGDCPNVYTVAGWKEKYANMGTTSDHPTWHKWPSEWPPKEGVYIVVQSEIEDIKPSMFTAHFCEEAGWWEDIEGNSYLDITHWRELPEPPAT